MGLLKITSVALMSAVLILIGCGGGGGSSNQTDPLAKTEAVDISNQSVSWTPQQAKWAGKDAPSVAPEPGAQDFAPLLRRSFKIKSAPNRLVKNPPIHAACGQAG